MGLRPALILVDLPETFAGDLPDRMHRRTGSLVGLEGALQQLLEALHAGFGKGRLSDEPEAVENLSAQFGWLRPRVCRAA